jgi:hypothetical protein
MFALAQQNVALPFPFQIKKKRKQKTFRVVEIAISRERTN